MGLLHTAVLRLNFGGTVLYLDYSVLSTMLVNKEVISYWSSDSDVGHNPFRGRVPSVYLST